MMPKVEISREARAFLSEITDSVYLSLFGG